MALGRCIAWDYARDYLIIVVCVVVGMYITFFAAPAVWRAIANWFEARRMNPFLKRIRQQPDIIGWLMDNKTPRRERWGNTFRTRR